MIYFIVDLPEESDIIYHMEKLFKNNRETVIDPSKSSFLEENLELEESGIVETPSMYNGALSKTMVYVDKKTGEEFFPLSDNKRPEFQRLISYVLKGVINTADIVKYNGNYFSHKQNLKNVEKGDEYFKEEIKVDLFILKNIFGDYDHSYYKSEDYNFQTFVKQRNTTVNEVLDMDVEHRNVVINESNRNSYFFDLERSGYIGLGKGEGFHSLQIKTDEDMLQYKKFLINNIFSPENKSQKFNMKTLQVLEGKVNSLINNIFSQENYNVFKKIIDRSGTQLNETTFGFYSFHSQNMDDRIKEIFEDICMRCKTAKDTIIQILDAQKNNSDSHTTN